MECFESQSKTIKDNSFIFKGYFCKINIVKIYKDKIILPYYTKLTNDEINAVF